MAAPQVLPEFRDATRQQAKASILIEGLTGSGKSGLALLLGYYLADKDMTKEYAIDTENKSLDLFQGLQLSDGTLCNPPFKKVDLLEHYGYSPSTYNALKDNAVKNGAKVVIMDSITHMWQRKGGMLELVSKISASATNKKNGWSAWGEPEVVSEKEQIYAMVRDSRVHVICTVRVKEKHEMITNEQGKQELKSLGEQQICMPELKYEPDLVLSMESSGTIAGKAPRAKVIKTRYAILEKDNIYEFTPSLCKQIADYLKEGADPAVLLEHQRTELIAATKAILDADVSKRTMYPLLIEELGHPGAKLAELPLKTLQTLLGVMIN